MATFYLRVEGVNLSNFVFDNQELSTIRGGSFLLLDAIAEVRTHFEGKGIAEVISGGASSGLFQLNVSDMMAAKKLRDDVREFLSTDTKYKHATFVVAVAKEGNDFSLVRERLLALNRWQQMQSPSVAVPSFNSSTGVATCEVDLVRPASRKKQVRKGDSRKFASDSVRRRVAYGRRQKQDFIVFRTDRTIEYYFAYDLDELSRDDQSRGNLNHKIAVIYLDGNSIGKLQNEKCTTADDQQKFDIALNSYRRAWLNALIDEMKSNDDWFSHEGRYRFEALQWAGDEITIIVPARFGWRTLEILFNTVNGGMQDEHHLWTIDDERKWQFDGSPLTFAAGIVFCHYNAPINRITRLAYDLGNIAKKDKDETGKESKATRNQFAYEILESFDHVGRNLETYRKEQSPLVIANGAVQRNADLTQMILSGDSIGTIQEYIAAIKTVIPRRKLYQITQLLFSSDITDGGNVAQKIAAVMKDARDALQGKPDAAAAMKQFEALQTSAGKGQETAWAHLAALWDYVG